MNIIKNIICNVLINIADWIPNYTGSLWLWYEPEVPESCQLKCNDK